MFTQLSAVCGGLFGELCCFFLCIIRYSFHFSFENFHVNCIAQSRSQLELARKWSDFWLFFSLLALFSLARACHFVVHCFMHWSLSYTFYFQLSNLVELSVSTIATGRAKSPNQFSLSLSSESGATFLMRNNVDAELHEQRLWLTEKKNNNNIQTTSKQTQKLSHFQFTVDLLFDCLPGWIENKSWIVSFLPLYWWAHCFPPSCCRLRSMIS